LTQRAASGLPRVNRLTELYNGISVLHNLPLGGENLDAYVGAPKLICATGNEEFETPNGIERPQEGEVMWCNEKGITCRNWNWRHVLELH